WSLLLVLLAWFGLELVGWWSIRWTSLLILPRSLWRLIWKRLLSSSSISQLILLRIESRLCFLKILKINIYFFKITTKKNVLFSAALRMHHQLVYSVVADSN